MKTIKLNTEIFQATSEEKKTQTQMIDRFFPLKIFKGNIVLATDGVTSKEEIMGVTEVKLKSLKGRKKYATKNENNKIQS